MSRDPFQTVESMLNEQRESPSRYQPYRPGEPLEPIGETVTGESLGSSQRPASDPFMHPAPEYYDNQYLEEDYVPPSPQSSYNTYDHYDVDIADSHGPGSYSSYSPSPRRPGIRSRSPTPAVDDEDYHIIGEDSVHYTGLRHHPVYDEEKALDKPPSFSNSYRQDSFEEYSYTSSLQEKDSEPVVERRHFGPAPTGRITRRHNEVRPKKRIQLTKGNLIVHLPVPPKLILPYKGEFETTRTTYSGVTCDPDDFEQHGFTLRQVQWKRRTELMIVITMYNEDEILFCRTLYGVMKNIAHLCSRKNSRTWGPDSWKKVVVVIVADGRKKVHPRVLDCLSLLGVYQYGGHMKNLINKKAVRAHLFEHTASFALDPNLHFKYPDEGIVPTQFIFCMKEKNEKKINSHRWCFNAFAHMLQPNVCILLDVGTRPGNNSIYRLWKTFDLNSNVAGACGEISAYKGRRWSLLLNPLVAAQNVEYKLSNILDKTTESVFGYISVLPGAFSAYRYIALQNDENGVGPLASYFKGEALHNGDPDVKNDIFTSNMYLAEDRILCFELVAKKHCNWVLKYVKGAVGETDVPDALPEFISQRRRWLNGSFFAATYAVTHAGQILKSGHSVTRKTFLMLQTAYNVVTLIFTWFSLGNFYLFFIVLTSSLEDDSFGLQPVIGYVNPLLHYGLAAMIIACFLFSMGNKPQGSPWKYKLTAILFSGIMAYLLFASIICAVHAAKQGGEANSVMLLSVIITYGCYLYGSVLAMDPWHMVNSFIQYMFMVPTFINILSIYAFSNLDDISWGTKQDADPEGDLGAVVQNSLSQVDVDVNDNPEDANYEYEQAAIRIRDREKLDEKARQNPSPPTNAEKAQIVQAYFANMRANILLGWVLSNGLLLVVILNGGAKAAFGSNNSPLTKGYITFILAFTCITNLIRAMGSTIYFVTRFILG